MTLTVFKEKETDFELNTMAQLSAIQGKQFGRNIYSSMVKFKDLDKFLATFPEVQRQINPRKVNAIKRYILTGIDNNSLRFFSSMTVTCRGTIFYDNVAHRVAIDVNESKLSINDGQHRAEAINQVLAYLESEFVKSNDREKTTRIKSYIDELKDMVIPVVIYDNLTEEEEAQLFYDLNNLAQRPSKNANIRLNMTDLVSKMARELAAENKYLKYYGVEQDKMSIQKGSENTILLATLHSMIKELLADKFALDRDFLNKRNYESNKKAVNTTLLELFLKLPGDLNVKGKYLIEKSYTLKSIARFINHGRTHLDLSLSDAQIFDIIAEVDWSYNIEFWEKYGASETKEGNIVFPGGGHGAQKSVYEALVDQVK